MHSALKIKECDKHVRAQAPKERPDNMTETIEVTKREAFSVKIFKCSGWCHPELVEEKAVEICYLEFVKEFGSANHWKLPPRMHIFGVSERIFNLVGDFSRSGTSCLKVMNGKTYAPLKGLVLMPSLFFFHSNGLPH